MTERKERKTSGAYGDSGKYWAIKTCKVLALSTWNVCGTGLRRKR